MKKILLVQRLSMVHLEAAGLSHLSERSMNCDVPVFKIESPENIVVIREGNWTNFPFNELQEKLGKGAYVKSVDYIAGCNTTIIVFKDIGAIPTFEKLIVTNGTGEEFSIQFYESQYCRPPFHLLAEFEI